MGYGKILARLRKEKGLTQAQAAEYLSRHSGKACSYKVMSHWEKGVSSPAVEQFLLLCECYGVSDIQGTFRNAHLVYSDLPRLNALGKSRVEEYISMLLTNPMFTEVEVEAEAEIEDEGEPCVTMPLRSIKLYTISAAAGTGSFLDSDHHVELEIDETVPNAADFAVRVSGDSMEPRFFDGQVIFVKEQRSLEVGEIGIFSLNGDSYIKKLGSGQLVSLNPRYKPITIREFDSLHVFGKVVG